MHSADTFTELLYYQSDMAPEILESNAWQKTFSRALLVLSEAVPLARCAEHASRASVPFVIAAPLLQGYSRSCAREPSGHRIRRLDIGECFRHFGCSDEDFKDRWRDVSFLHLLQPRKTFPRGRQGRGRRAQLQGVHALPLRLPEREDEGEGES